MADFRRWFTALAMVALFCGLASAQANFSGGMTCTTTSTVTPLVRAEGLTELVGDIVLACSGGTNVAPGGPIPTANITVFLNTNVTSRLMGNGGSEALLLIDEPGSTVGGYGTTVPQTVCPSPTGGTFTATYGTTTCQEYVGTVGANAGVPVQGATGVASTTAGWNVWQGVVTSQQAITFFGVPILPPVTAGATRVFRITNVRANAAGITGGAGVGQITSNISVSPSNAFTLNQSVLTVAYIQPGLGSGTLNTALNGGLSVPGFAQCSRISLPGNPSNGVPAPAVAGIRFSPGFATAFKTRVALVNGNTSTTSLTTASQNIPGQVYNSESGFTLNVNPAGGGSPTTSQTAGLADFGTRLKAVFNNVPSGVTIYVSSVNYLNNNGTLSNTVFATTAAAPYAQAVISETVPDANGPLAFASTVSQPAGYIQVPVSGGTGVAVWEVLLANYNTIQDYDFGVIISYSANALNNPAPQALTVNESFAPNATNGAFSASSGPNASGSLPIPRFVDTSAQRTLANFNICSTVLLFPYVVTGNGFDTGMAISNTSQDPFGTTPQTGSCTLNWYMGGVSSTTNPAATSIAPIPAGTTWTSLASATANAGANFTGYMFAVCNFQLGHGYAAITDVGSRSIFSSYLALVVTTGQGSRGGIESLAH